MAEEYIPEMWKKGAVEYRVTCFNDIVEIISVYSRTGDNEGRLSNCGHFDRE